MGTGSMGRQIIGQEDAERPGVSADAGRCFGARELAETALVLLAVFGPGSQSALAADSQATVSATVVAPVSLRNTSNLTFGALEPSHVRGTVALETDGQRWASWVDLPGGPNGDLAAFRISGAPNSAFTVTLPDRVVLVPGDAGLQITDFAHSAGICPMLGPTGVVSFEIGAVLHAGPSLAQGSHLASFHITVSLD